MDSANGYACFLGNCDGSGPGARCVLAICLSNLSVGPIWITVLSALRGCGRWSAPWVLKVTDRTARERTAHRGGEAWARTPPHAARRTSGWGASPGWGQVADLIRWKFIERIRVLRHGTDERRSLGNFVRWRPKR